MQLHISFSCIFRILSVSTQMWKKIYATSFLTFYGYKTTCFHLISIPKLKNL